MNKKNKVVDIILTIVLVLLANSSAVGHLNIVLVEIAISSLKEFIKISKIGNTKDTANNTNNQFNRQFVRHNNASCNHIAD